MPNFISISNLWRVLSCAIHIFGCGLKITKRSNIVFRMRWLRFVHILMFVMPGKLQKLIYIHLSPLWYRNFYHYNPVDCYVKPNEGHAVAWCHLVTNTWTTCDLNRWPRILRLGGTGMSKLPKSPHALEMQIIIFHSINRIWNMAGIIT